MSLLENFRMLTGVTKDNHKTRLEVINNLAHIKLPSWEHISFILTADNLKDILFIQARKDLLLHSCNLKKLSSFSH